MWLFFSRHLRQWLILSVAVPAVGAAARGLGAHLEKRNGSTPMSRSLTKVGHLAARRKAPPPPSAPKRAAKRLATLGRKP